MDAHEKQELLDAIKESHLVNYQAYHDLLENSIKAFSSQLSVFEERNTEQHHQITTRQDLTNGRVNCLEKETAVVRWCTRNPKLAAIVLVLIFSGAVTLGVTLGIDNLLGIWP